ncbi:MAG: NYN domain-containing protein [Dehalococcoidia bacterium]
MSHLVVDAMNVIGSRPDGWWRNRDAAVRRLVERLQSLAPAEASQLTVVVDGRPLPDLPEGLHGAVQVLYASRPGRNAADDRIMEFVEEHPDAGSLLVVTSDGDLSRRASACGAEVHGATWLLERLDEFG